MVVLGAGYIYTPNLGLGIAVLGREREQGRFRGSSEGAAGEHRGAAREHEGALWGIAGGSRWEPEMASSASV